LSKRDEDDDMEANYKLLEMNIQNMLSGIYKHITRVYGTTRIPKEFTELFNAVAKKRNSYDQWEMKENKEEQRKIKGEKDEEDIPF
jgi:hypothetical protein